jgi:hypothetical protein
MKVNLKKMSFFADPGHGWLKVPKKDLVALGIADKISTCSYQLGENAYLEEDSDAAKFFEAMIAQGYDAAHIREMITCKSTDKRSKIRSYDSYSA